MTFRALPPTPAQALTALDRLLQRRWIQALIFATALVLALSLGARTAYAEAPGYFFSTAN